MPSRHLAAALVGRAVRHRRLALDPELVLLVGEHVGELGVLEQRLRRDAPDVEADTAPVLLLHDGDGLAELGRADRGDVATGAGAEDQNIEVVVTGPSLSTAATVPGSWSRDPEHPCRPLARPHRAAGPPSRPPRGPSGGRRLPGPARGQRVAAHRTAHPRGPRRPHLGQVRRHGADARHRARRHRHRRHLPGRRGTGWAQVEVAERAAKVQAEVGWCLDPAYQGRGLRRRSGGGVAADMLDLGVRWVVANSFADNTASWRLMERLGMRWELYTVRECCTATADWLTAWETTARGGVA